MATGDFKPMRYVAHVEVDEAAWAQEYGMDPKDRIAIRDDIVIYLTNLIQNSSAGQAGLLRLA
jgi:hypothetical protein